MGQLLNEARAAALQREEELAAQAAFFTKATRSERGYPSMSYPQERRVPMTADARDDDEAWQDYDASLWVSSPSDAPPASGSVLKPTHAQMADSASSTQGLMGPVAGVILSFRWQYSSFDKATGSPGS